MDMSTSSSVEELLRYMRVADEDLLDELEHDYAGSIKLGPCGRYGCRLLVKGELFEFALGPLPDGDEDFFVTKNGLPFEVEKDLYCRRLYQLVRHRAAEVIGGVRAGHTEYNIRRTAKRDKKQKERG